MLILKKNQNFSTVLFYWTPKLRQIMKLIGSNEQYIISSILYIQSKTC